jgi:hypothetical protein
VKVKNKPTIAQILPITSIQIDLFVGDPVKNLDISDENDCDALTPKMINTTPAARSASPRNLFMCLFQLKAAKA